MKEATELAIVNAYIDGVCIVDIVKQFGIGRCSIYYYSNTISIICQLNFIKKRVSFHSLLLFCFGVCIM